MKSWTACLPVAALLACDGNERPVSAPAAVAHAAAASLAPSAPTIECERTAEGLPKAVLVPRDGIRAVQRPEGGAGPVGLPLKMFRKLQIFRTLPAQGQAGFYQLGETNDRSSILPGWFSAAELVRWDHVLVGEYLVVPGRHTPPLLVYADPEPLWEFMATGEPPRDKAPIARATFRGKRALLPFPIVEVLKRRIKDREREVWKVHFLGEFREGADLRSAAPQAAKGGGSPYTDQELAQFQEAVLQLDVVFVIDVTGSMQPYIDAALAVVRRLADELTALPGKPNVAFGLVAYRDHDPRSKFVVQHHDLDSAKVLIGRLSALRAGEGEDRAEAVYDGVHAALEQTRWRSALGAHLIVLVGDASAHEPGDRQNPRNLSRDQLVELANGQTRHVQIMSLVVNGNEKCADKQRCWTQFRDLAERTGGTCAAVEEAQGLVVRVGEVLDGQRATVARREQVFVELARGRSTAAEIATERELDIREVTHVLEFLAGAGLDIKRIGKGVPTFCTGYVLPELPGGVQVLERELYVARPDIDLLLGTLHHLVARLSPNFGHSLVDCAVGARTGLLSEFLRTDRAEPLDAFLIAKGLPVGRTSLLALSRAEILNMSETQRAAVRERLARSVIPTLSRLRNDDSLWFRCAGVEVGVLPETCFP